MPHKFYHGRTGRVWNITKRAIGVEVNKQVTQLAEKLKTNLEKGIPGSDEDILQRKNVYGTNTYPRKKGRSFWRFLWEACQDLILIILMVAAVASLALGITSELDAYCSAIAKKIKDSYGWNGEVKFKPSVGAWIGEFPLYLRYNHEADPIDQDITGSPKVSTTNKE